MEKQSIALNLKNPRGRETLMRLIRESDVLIEGFRPGVMERLDLGPDECLKENPRLVYGRMTGWGQDGPLSHSAGHDLNYLAITGALHAMGKEGEPPLPPLNLVADYGGGSMFLLLGILSALFERGISGKGQVIDAAMVDGVPAMMGMIQTMLKQGNWTKNREDNFLDGAAPFYRCYKTSDEKFISVGPIEPQFFAEFVKLAGLDPALCEKQNDKSQWSTMTELITKTIATKTRDEWSTIFEGTDACVAPVLDFEEAATYPANIARNVFFETDGVTQVNPVPGFSRSNPSKPKKAGVTGADGHTILLEAGFDPVQITALKHDGILF